MTMRLPAFSLVAALLLLAFASFPLQAAEELSPAAQIEKLVEQLDAADAADRDAAEKLLVELGLKDKSAASGEAFVDLLPKPNDEMPQEVQVRLARIAAEIRNRIAKQAIEGELDGFRIEGLAIVERHAGAKLESDALALVQFFPGFSQRRHDLHIGAAIGQPIEDVGGGRGPVHEKGVDRVP